MIFVGVDWAEAHHDVHVEDDTGRRLGGGRLTEGMDGIARFHDLVGAHVDEPEEVVIGIETDRGLFVAALVAAGLATLNHAGFPTGAMDPVEVLLPPAGSPATVTDGSPAAVTDGSPATATDGSPAAVTLTHDLAELRGVYTVVAPASPAWHRDGTNLLDVLPDSPTSFGGNAALVGAVQRQLATAAPGAAETGTSPVEYDLVHAIYGRTLIVLSLVGLATLLILSVAFRSIIVAIKALVLNVLSIGATIGALVLVWQRGYGSHAIWGISTTGAVIDFVPLIVFAFLFGLSMDYEVFIVSRIKEAHDSGSPPDEAIVAGISRTGRLVTSAAAVLVLAFAALSAGPQVSLKMFATGLAFGIFIDATVVRCLLVPAALSLLGERAWWLPGRLRVAQAVPADVVP